MDPGRTALLCFMLIALGSCKKEESDPTPAPTQPAEYMLRVSFTFMKDAFVQYAFSDLLHDEAGHLVKLDRARFIVSNIRTLNDAGGTIRAFPGVVLSVDRALGSTSTFDLGLAQVGNYPRIAFDIGLDDASNAMQPSDFTQPPLSDQTLYQSAALGYKFAELTGYWDSDGNFSAAPPDEAVTYICATASMRRSKDIYINHGHQDGTSVIGLKVSMTDILNGINCDNTPSAIGGSSVNAQLMSNLQAAVND